MKEFVELMRFVAWRVDKKSNVPVKEREFALDVMYCLHRFRYDGALLFCATAWPVCVPESPLEFFGDDLDGQLLDMQVDVSMSTVVYFSLSKIIMIRVD